MEYFVNCNTSSLATYTTPLDKSKVAHLYRRLGFSASINTINAAVGISADVLIDQLINDAITLAPSTAPVWADWTAANYPEDDNARRTLINEQREEWRTTYGNALLNNNLRDRLSFFWSNHFVTELDVYDCNSFLYHYINCLQRNALGNFKTFVSEIGLTNAMLYYLDGVFNNGNNPNENYARELYELFSLGDGNGYTEEDIIETAKALTGYVERGEIGCSPVTFNPERHDAGPKTIFGQTANFDYDGVIDNLFDQRPTEIAGFICKKLYEFFVHPDSKEGNAPTIIDGLASTFVTNNFELAPVLSQLFKSQHFFDDEAIGVIIKSPMDMFFNFTKETNFAYTDVTVAGIAESSRMLSQELFDPVDVAGWQRNRSWINTNFLIGRWITSAELIDQFWNNSEAQFRDFGIAATGANGATTNDPAEVTKAIVDKLIPVPDGLFDYDTATTVFREPYEDTGVFEDGNNSWNMTFDDSPRQVYLLLQYIIRQPEFQLK